MLPITIVSMSCSKTVACKRENIAGINVLQTLRKFGFGELQLADGGCVLKENPWLGRSVSFIIFQRLRPLAGNYVGKD